MELELEFPSIKNNLLIFCLSNFLSLCFFICPNIWPCIAKSCELLGCCVSPGNCICSLPSCVTAYLPTFTCLVDEVFVDFLLPIDMTCLHSINVLAVLNSCSIHWICIGVDVGRSKAWVFDSIDRDPVTYTDFMILKTYRYQQSSLAYMIVYILLTFTFGY